MEHIVLRLTGEDQQRRLGQGLIQYTALHQGVQRLRVFQILSVVNDKLRGVKCFAQDILCLHDKPRVRLLRRVAAVGGLKVPDHLEQHLQSVGDVVNIQVVLGIIGGEREGDIPAVPGCVAAYCHRCLADGGGVVEGGGAYGDGFVRGQTNHIRRRLSSPVVDARVPDIVDIIRHIGGDLGVKEIEADLLVLTGDSLNHFGDGAYRGEIPFRRPGLHSDGGAYRHPAHLPVIQQPVIDCAVQLHRAQTVVLRDCCQIAHGILPCILLLPAGGKRQVGGYQLGFVKQVAALLSVRLIAPVVESQTVIALGAVAARDDFTGLCAARYAGYRVNGTCLTIFSGVSVDGIVIAFLLELVQGVLIQRAARNDQGKREGRSLPLGEKVYAGDGIFCGPVHRESEVGVGVPAVKGIGVAVGGDVRRLRCIVVVKTPQLLCQI